MSEENLPTAPPLHPTTTNEELFALAKAKAFVRWYPSLCIERVFLTKDKKAVLASGRFTVFHWVARGVKKETFLCEKIDPSVMTKEEQREAARRTKWFKDPDAEPKKPKKEKKS